MYFVTTVKICPHSVTTDSCLLTAVTANKRTWTANTRTYYRRYLPEIDIEHTRRFFFSKHGMRIERNTELYVSGKQEYGRKGIKS